MAIQVYRTEELPKDVVTRDFVGEQHGGVGTCVLFVDARDRVPDCTATPTSSC